MGRGELRTAQAIAPVAQLDGGSVSDERLSYLSGLAFCGFTFRLVLANMHCARSAGTKWDSPIVGSSEMVVMREFHDPSAELAWAAKGSASRSSAAARVCKSETFAGLSPFT